MRSSSSLGLIVCIVGFSALSGCMKESSTSNLDGTCKGDFIDAYNATGRATNRVADLQRNPHRSGAEYADALEKAQVACHNLMTNYSDGGECQANRTGSPADLKSNCDIVDSELARLRGASATSAEIVGESAAFSTVESL